MQSTGWMADDMPRVSFKCGKEEGQFHQRICCMDAHVKLPDGTFVVLDNVTFHGINGEEYRFSGRIKRMPNVK